MAHFLSPLIDADPTAFRLLNARTGETLASRLIAALDSSSRRTGLLKHASLPQGEAMIIAPCSSVHTFFMKFPLDILYVTKDGRVLKVREAVPAWRVSGSLRAFAVIEMRAGEFARSKGRVGDRLELVPAR